MKCDQQASGAIVIPDTVTEINECAFYSCIELTSVTIPEGVISIGQFAFAHCSSLTSITIPGSITSIGDGAFLESGLTSIIYNGTEEQWNALGVDTYGIPVIYNEGSQSGGNQNSALTVENGVVVKCDPEASGFIKIEPGVRAIASDAFNGCSKLEAIVISDGVTSIGGNAFQGCTSLVSVQIPSSVTSVGNGAFEYCNKLSKVNFTGTAGQFAMLELDTKKVFNDINSVFITCCYGMQNEGICHFVSRGDSSLTGYVIIPSGTTVINENAFERCDKLKDIVIPGSVKEIESRAFDGCSSLTSVTIPSGVTSISKDTFSGCSSLTRVAIPSSVTSIGESAFFGCYSLVEVIIPDSVTAISHSLFSNCNNLKNITFLGTKMQWEAIKKSNYKFYWNSGSKITTVSCTDGKIYL